MEEAAAGSKCDACALTINEAFFQALGNRVEAKRLAKNRVYRLASSVYRISSTRRALVFGYKRFFRALGGSLRTANATHR